MDRVRKIEHNKKALLELLLLADPSEEMIDRYLGPGEMWVLLDGETPVSEAVIVPLSASSCELKNLATLPGRQGEGLATELLGQLFLHYGPRYSAMLVGTSEYGMAFYRRLGFTYSHTVRGFFLEHYPKPIYENGVRCKDMLYLKKDLFGEREI